jgi:DNA-binding response OmpR family regulator
MVRENPYDIVLMDIQMPVMDGVTATKLIRNTLTAPAKDVKIVALTANVLQEDVVKYFDVGMDGYVSKPFQVDELLSKMEEVLANQAKTRLEVDVDGLVEKPAVEARPKAVEHERVNYNAQKAERSLPDMVTDKEFLKQFTGGNPERMRKYVKMFMENATRLLISMDLALQAKDYGAIKIAAHSLKPQLSYMGVKEDVSHIFMIEQSAGSSAHFDNLENEILELNKVVNKAFEELKHLA